MHGWQLCQRAFQILLQGQSLGHVVRDHVSRDAPVLLDELLRLKSGTRTLFAGQISGVEGYTESIATGMLAGIYAASLAQGVEPTPIPRATALGSLVHYITHADAKDFQPANITFDLLEPLEEGERKKVRDKKERHRMVCERALEKFDTWWAGLQVGTSSVVE